MDTPPENNLQFSMETLLIGMIVAGIGCWAASLSYQFGPLLAWLVLAYCLGALARIHSNRRLGVVCASMLILALFWFVYAESTGRPFPYFPKKE